MADPDTRPPQSRDLSDEPSMGMEDDPATSSDRGEGAQALNRRILVIDDNPRIHDDFRTILVRDADGVDFLLDMEAELFGEPNRKKAPESTFEVDSAYQGREGLEMVQRALEEGRPYAMAFVDVRMPPGWDGIETIKRIWEVDPHLQVVICTAYSDYSWEETVEILHPCERFLILKKPFDTVVVRQLAHSLTEKWHLTQQARKQLLDLRQTVHERSRDLEEVNHRLRREAAERESLEALVRRAWSLEEDQREEVGDSVSFLQGSFGDLNELLSSYQALLGRASTRTPEDERELEQLLREIPPAVTRTLEGIERVSGVVHAVRDAGVATPPASQQAVDLDRIVANALTAALEDYRPVAEVEVSYQEVPPVRCEPQDLGQALLAVLVNAAHAVADVVGDSQERGTIRVRTWADGDDAVITVADTGGGIPEEFRDQIFEPFFTTKDVGRGTGHGLAVARRIVEEEHGGTLTFESDLGRGTTFHLRVPVAGKPSS